MSNSQIYVVSAARTAIGSFGGSLRDQPLCHLATHVVGAALSRSGIPAEAIGHVVMGNVIPTEPRDAYLSRVAAMDAGIPKETPAFNVNRLCGSGLQAVISAAQAIMLGDTDIAIGGGAESMSRGPYLMPAMRWGARLGDSGVTDYMNGILHDPWKRNHMGVTAENVAKRFGITRENRMNWRWRASEEPPMRWLQVTLKNRLRALKFKHARQPAFSTRMSMCVVMSPWTNSAA
jgi:acetyl-CoA C-acetyltransferase